MRLLQPALEHNLHMLAQLLHVKPELTLELLQLGNQLQLRFIDACLVLLPQPHEQPPKSRNN